MIEELLKKIFTRVKEIYKKRIPEYLICLFRIPIAKRHDEYYGFYTGNFYQWTDGIFMIDGRIFSFKESRYCHEITKLKWQEDNRDIVESGILAMLETAVSSGRLENWFGDWQKGWKPGKLPFIVLYFNSQKEVIKF